MAPAPTMMPKPHKYSAITSTQTKPSVNVADHMEEERSSDPLIFTATLTMDRLLKLDMTNALKSCTRELAEPIAMLFQKLFDTGKAPGDWKTANICPIYKDSRNVANNHRPVLRTSVPCKLMKTIIINELLTNLAITRHKPSTNQHGFTKGRSGLTNLLVTLEEWI